MKKINKFKLIILNLILNQTTKEIKIFVKSDPFISILNSMFGKDYELFDFQHGQEKGHPDYMIITNNRKLYIEWKDLGDGIRASQVEWIFNNPLKSSIIIMRE